MIESVEFFAPQGLSLSAKLFHINSDVVAATATSVYEQAGTKGSYVAEFDSVVGDIYLIVAYDGGQAIAAAYAYLAETAQTKRAGFYADTLCAAQVELMRKITLNKTVTDPQTGIMTVMDDDDLTPYLQAPMYEDASQTQPYRGRGAEVRGRLE